jgi:peptidoglycan/xylan/chitin deacetylase (PgdA/CDA1 family)
VDLINSTQKPIGALRTPNRAVRLARFVPSSILFARGSAAKRQIALTFDDGPHPEYTPAILDALARHHARATFFMVGECAREWPELVRRIVHEGHAIGDHTTTHVDLSRLSPAETWQELRRSTSALEEIAGTRVRYLRPPWGHMALWTPLVAVACGLRIALWSLDSLDYSGLGPSGLIARLERTVPEPGDVLLFHDENRPTAEALPMLLEYLRELDLDCVTLDELLGRR